MGPAALFRRLLKNQSRSVLIFQLDSHNFKRMTSWTAAAAAAAAADAGVRSVPSVRRRASASASAASTPMKVSERQKNRRCKLRLSSDAFSPLL